MEQDKRSFLRLIPKVDRLMAQDALIRASKTYPRPLVHGAIREVLDSLREEILRNEIVSEEVLDISEVAGRVIDRLRVLARPSLVNLINATGVVVHTNLGRSILAKRALRSLGRIAGGYSNLEYDLELGKRGSRYTHVEGILRELTGAEAAMVVNNNAAAVLLTLDTIARGKEVIVSRGQLVEIGGSFRIPEVMKRSGAKMVEVGTTNKTHLRDYESAINDQTALLLKVHTSNYKIIGFTKEVTLAELSQLGRRAGIPVMEDLGSGCFIDFSEMGLEKEPTVQEVLAAGADIVTFSGDKLLGGPQAGIILGRKDLVEAVRRNQLTRALRIDKLTLAALEETLFLYRDKGRALREIPTLRMIASPYHKISARAERLARMLGDIRKDNFTISLTDGSSKVGGGALPGLALPTRLLSIVPAALSAAVIEQWLRRHHPPIICRVEKDHVLLDPRTIKPAELKTVAGALVELANLRLED
jgi:L-seryl-tRNA(Ser) seleniumtransferase